MKINSLSETVITVTLGEVISMEMHREVIRFYRFVQKLSLPEVTEVVMSYASVTLYTDLAYGERSFKEVVLDICARYSASGSEAVRSENKEVQIPVEYRGEDLEEVSRYCGLSVAEAIQIHSGTDYVVAMMGFRPGFPYLLGLDERLHVPRRATPRLRVPKGAVAIGGQQTGIYPGESPGGWHLIGYTALPLFDVNRQPPNLLEVGDKVRFISL